MQDALKDYTRFDFNDGRWTRPVFRRGQGPAVIIIHEMPGLHPLVVRFGDRVAAAGMTVFLPSLFGEPGRPVSPRYAIGEMLKGICISREFHVWARNKSSPIVDWLRALARKAHAECGGKGVGAIGMCFTGNFALAMMTEPAVVAPAMSQPSLPLGFTDGAKAAMGISPDELACARKRFETEDLSLLGLRFKGDPIVTKSRFDSFRRAFGDRFEAIELDDEHALPAPGFGPHSVLTLNLIDEDTSATRQAERRVIEFFKERTGA
jgi:dienelactone hydrolase